MQKQKNRYYHGKMLRSDDFICEQAYMLDQMKARTHAALGEGDSIWSSSEQTI